MIEFIIKCRVVLLVHSQTSKALIINNINVKTHVDWQGFSNMVSGWLAANQKPGLKIVLIEQDSNMGMSL